MKAIRHIPIAESFSFGWKKTWENVGFILAFMLVGLGAQIALGVTQGIFSGALKEAEGGVGLVVLIFSLLRMVVNVVLALAGLNAVLQIVADKRPSLKSVFAGMTQGGLILQYLILSVVVGLLVSLGFIFFIIPGIYLSLKWLFTGYVLVDKRSSFQLAMAKSSQITGGVKWELIGFGIASFFINLLGLLALGIGLLVTIPMTEIARGYVYRHLMKTG